MLGWYAGDEEPGFSANTCDDAMALRKPGRMETREGEDSDSRITGSDLARRLTVDTLSTLHFGRRRRGHHRPLDMVHSIEVDGLRLQLLSEHFAFGLKCAMSIGRRSSG